MLVVAEVVLKVHRLILLMELTEVVMEPGAKQVDLAGQLIQAAAEVEAVIGESIQVVMVDLVL